MATAAPYPGAEPAMDCLSALEARNAGRTTEPAVAAHLAACPLCRVGSRSPDLPAPPFEAVEQSVASERGIRAGLRGLPTRARLGLALGVVAALLLATFTFARRAERPLPGVQLLGGLLLTVGAGVLLRENLLPLQAPRRPGRQQLLVALGLALPGAIALLPLPEALRQGALPGVAPSAATRACLIMGCLVAGLVALFLRALDRGAHRSAWAAVTAAAAGGMVGALALDLHCPITTVDHLLVGHGSAGLALGLVYGAVVVALRRRAA
ncbi:MAG: hypothetical protein FJ104_00935 [Deltaproteobacteria bacterium]|nr:hypothetical protein [Deltaproteobacteria bacterium]